MIHRRDWFCVLGAGAILGATPRGKAAIPEKAEESSKPLALSDYEPRSMLHLKETHVSRARYAVIDIHTHLTFSAKIVHGVSLASERPRTARRFFDKYQDRILFGTDATPHGNEVPQQTYEDALYETHYRFLETDDEYFNYSPSKIPPQGRWRIYDINLPDGILKKVYLTNAARMLRVSV